MKQAHKTLLLWLLLIVVFVSIWGIFRSPDDASATPTTWSDYAPVFVIGGAFIAAFLFFWRLVAASRRMTAASNTVRAALAEDDFEAAAGAARSMPRWPRLYAIASDLQLANIDYSSGKLEDARARLAAGRPNGAWFFGFNQARFEIEAHWWARRAIIHAALDRDDEARADAARARRVGKRGNRAEATAEFSELVTLARRRDFPAVRARLDAWAFRSGLVCWEAAVLRALELFASSGGSSAYRSPTNDAEQKPPNPHLVRWAEAIVPGIGPYLESAPNKTVLAPRTSSVNKAARSRVASERDAGRAAPKARNPIGIAAIVALGGIFAFVFFAREGAEVLWTKIVPFILAIFAVFFVLFRRVGRDAELARTAEVQDESGKPDEAERTILPLTKGRSDAVIANALRSRALFAIHRGDAEPALDHCDQALAYLRRIEEEMLKGNKQKPARTAIGSFAFQHQAAAHRTIATTRAAALAMLGRIDEAEVELELAGEADVGARFVVDLYGLARAGDVAGLVELGRAAGSDLVLAPFEGAMLDAARMAGGDVVAARWLDRKLRSTAAVAAFLERGAPSIFARVKEKRNAATSFGAS